MADHTIRSLTAQIVAGYVAGNRVSTHEVPALILLVAVTLDDLAKGTDHAIAAATAEPNRKAPAVPVARSASHDSIVCLDCGKVGSVLKRHIRTAHGLTPEAYRARWSLPASYSLTAPAYAETRSTLAKQAGLGRHRAPLQHRRRA